MECRFVLIPFLAMYFTLIPGQAENPRRILGWKIVIVEGQGAINFTGKAPDRKLLVRVQQEFGAPGKGLPVTFTLPGKGPGGSFKHSGRSTVVFTDADGYAVVHGFRPNKIAGQYNIHVSAPVHGNVIAAVIQQTNAEAHASAKERVLHLFRKQH